MSTKRKPVSSEASSRMVNDASRNFSTRGRRFFLTISAGRRFDSGGRTRGATTAAAAGVAPALFAVVCETEFSFVRAETGAGKDSTLDAGVATASASRFSSARTFAPLSGDAAEA